MSHPHFPRFVRARLVEALTDTPVVLIHGPRQCGKTTLAREVGRTSGYTYLSFDDDVVRASAETDPIGFVGSLPERIILDEVQRVPTLFTALKAAVDENRTPGRFLQYEEPPRNPEGTLYVAGEGGEVRGSGGRE